MEIWGSKTCQRLKDLLVFGGKEMGEMVANFNINWRILFINISIDLISDDSFLENIKLQILINSVV